MRNAPPPISPHPSGFTAGTAVNDEPGFHSTAVTAVVDEPGFPNTAATPVVDHRREAPRL